MPRYFFDFDDGHLTTVDRIGTNLPDGEAARAEAIAALPDIIQDGAPPESGREITATVRDESGRRIFHARLSIRGEWVQEAEPDPA